jgi:hypothetical protein
MRSGSAVWSTAQRSEARGEAHRSGAEQRLGGEGGADSGPGLQRGERGDVRGETVAGWAGRVRWKPAWEGEGRAGVVGRER